MEPSTGAVAIPLLLGFLAIALLFPILGSVYAIKKGFNPVIWFFGSLGCLGFAILMSMPSANEAADATERATRIKNGNLTGGILAAIGVTLTAVRIFMDLGGSR